MLKLIFWLQVQEDEGTIKTVLLGRKKRWIITDNKPTKNKGLFI